MSRPPHPFDRSPLALACLIALLPWHGEARAQPEDDTLPAVSVSAPAPRQPRATITGLGDLPGWQSPAQATSFNQPLLRDVGVTRLADLTKLDASTTDAYNPVGYWDSLSVRGFVVSNAHNFRREGLPISAETRLPLDNKASVELLKGTSGIQAGHSAPGGLVNLVVKRPEARLRELTLGLNDRGGTLAAVDLSDRFGQEGRFGLRINAAAETLRPTVQAADGNRRLLALAGDWKLDADSRLEAEFEHSQHSQVSVPGFSLLGGTLPSAKAIDPTTNLNAQSWSRPVEMQGNTGSLRWTRNWAGGWRSQVSYGEQRLQSTDRGAFPFGCFAEGNLAAYCSNGSFDLYDFRSAGEHRRTRALNATLDGRVDTGAVRHDLRFGVLRARHDTDLQQAMYTYVGEGRSDGAFQLGEIAFSPDYANTLRSERSTELSVVDALSHDGPWRGWIGLRHARIQRDTALTDGSGGASLSQNATSGWVAVGYQLAPQTQAYASWGQGLEVGAVQTPPPSLGYRYANAGAVLPAKRSRQLELGIKGADRGHSWSANVFQVHRPVTDRVNTSDPVVFKLLNDGEAVHRGLEGAWQWRNEWWQTAASAMLLDTERRGSQRTDTAVNGKPAVNVPEHALKASVARRIASVWLQADVIHEGPRAVTADNRVRLPSWTRTDLSIRSTQTLAGQVVVWRANVHNAFNVRNWREAPTYSDHVYLMPLAARSISVSASFDF